MAARKNHRRRQKHADNQKAQHDVIGKMHGVVPAMLSSVGDGYQCDRTT
jgi:hypothetical protein